MKTSSVIFASLLALWATLSGCKSTGKRNSSQVTEGVRTLPKFDEEDEKGKEIDFTDQVSIQCQKLTSDLNVKPHAFITVSSSKGYGAKTASYSIRVQQPGKGAPSYQAVVQKDGQNLYFWDSAGTGTWEEAQVALRFKLKSETAKWLSDRSYRGIVNVKSSIYHDSLKEETLECLFTQS